jgi:hypothetical protein
MGTWHLLPGRPGGLYVNRKNEWVATREKPDQWVYLSTPERWALTAAITSVLGCAAIAASIYIPKLANDIFSPKEPASKAVIVSTPAKPAP